MPAAPRPSKKGTTVAFDILGVPANMQKKRGRKKKRVNRRLVFEETTRVR